MQWFWVIFDRAFRFHTGWQILVSVLFVLGLSLFPFAWGWQYGLLGLLVAAIVVYLRVDYVDSDDFQKNLPKVWQSQSKRKARRMKKP